MLKNINTDYKFWIKIDNTNISYPVLQHENNKYYLNTDFNKNFSKSGAIFLNSENRELNDFNTILYGHNMKNSTMFSDLVKFKNEDFFKKNNKITINDENHKYTYEIFSIYTQSNYDNFNNFSSSNFDKIAYLNFLKNKSLYQSNLSLEDTEKILTLITNSYEFSYAKIIIHAKLIDVL